MKERILLPDIARSICVLEIVAFWHIFDYCVPIDWKYDCEFLTKGALACFTFLSGLFCGKKEMNFKTFYLSRMKRFLPLLAIALVSFRLLHMTSLKSAALAIVGLSCFTPWQPLTLWYFAMIILFYWLTPVLLYAKSGKCQRSVFLYRALLCFLLFIILDILLPMDSRIIVYFPYYIGGVLVPIEMLKKIQKNIIPMIIVGVILLLVYKFISFALVKDLISAFGCMLLILSVSSILEKWGGKSIRIVAKYLSYTSMAAYLFHRIIYLLVKRVCHEEYLNTFQILFMIIILLVVSYFIQKSYDRFCDFCENRLCKLNQKNKDKHEFKKGF